MLRYCLIDIQKHGKLELIEIAKFMSYGWQNFDEMGSETSYEFQLPTK